jgi:hypothetical protein
MGDQKSAVEVPLWMPSGKKLALFTCLAGCVVIASALATTALANHRQVTAASAVANRQSGLALRWRSNRAAFKSLLM